MPKKPQPTKTERVVRWSLLQIRHVLVSLGLLFIIYIVFVSPEEVVNSIIDAHIGSYVKENNEALRNLTIDVIGKKCREPYSECYVQAIFSNVSDIHYFLSSPYKQLYDPLYVYYKGGDCKNVEVLFVSMLKSIGVPSKVICNAQLNHCVSYVPNTFGGDTKLPGYRIVDLVLGVNVEMADGEDPWGYLGVVDGFVDESRLGTNYCEFEGDTI